MLNYIPWFTNLTSWHHHNMLNQNQTHILAAHIQNALLLNKITAHNYRLWLNNVPKVNLKYMSQCAVYFIQVIYSITHHWIIGPIVCFHYLHLIHTTIIFPNNIFSNQLNNWQQKMKVGIYNKICFLCSVLYYHVISSHPWQINVCCKLMA